jgi:hypothetical protein
MARAALLLSLNCISVILSGCAYPRVVKYYDEECQIMARKIVLDVANVSVLDSCSNDTCLASLAAGAVLSVTSAVVSGSIVRVGNVLYWKERNKNCKRGEPYASGEAAQATQPATSASAASL